MLVNILITIAELFIISSFLSNNILVLRGVSALGMTVYVVAGFVAGLKTEGMIALIFFSGIAAAINFVKLFFILKDTLSIFLPDHMRKIREMYFSSMSNSEFIQIYKFATETFFYRGDLVIEEGVHNSLLVFIEEGLASIDHSEGLIVSSGNFIGEMSYITKNVTTTAVYALSEQLRCLVWGREDLEKLESSMPQVYQKFFRIIAIDLVNKLAKNT